MGAERDQWNYGGVLRCCRRDAIKPMTDLYLWRSGTSIELIQTTIAGSLSEVAVYAANMEYRVSSDLKPARDYQIYSRLALRS